MNRFIGGALDGRTKEGSVDAGFLEVPVAVVQEATRLVLRVQRYRRMETHPDTWYWIAPDDWRSTSASEETAPLEETK